MTLQELLKDFSLPPEFSSIATQSAHVTAHSGRVRPGSVFVALKGASLDGHQFIPEAIKKGARVVVAETLPALRPKEVFFISTPDSLSAFSQLCAHFFQYPLKKLQLIGITGTNGKTTTTFLIQHLLNQKSKCGLIGTILYDTLQKKIEASNTTPGLEDLYAMFQEMVEAGARYCVMEVSSHALKQRRVEGLDFSQSIFTNLTQDHLDYHVTFEDYFASKMKLFTDFPTSVAIVNQDDPYGAKLFSTITNPRLSFGIQQAADVRALNLNVGLNGVQFEVEVKGEKIKIQSGLAGTFNVYNLLAAISACLTAGMTLKECQKGIETFTGVKGRMERIDCGQAFSVFVDYAHTPDAVENVLRSVKPLAKGRVITVLGCGGNRDRLKRPLMGAVAGRLSDLVFLTSDNPRNEDPMQIIDEVKAGLETARAPYRIESNRRLAIEQVLKEAKPKDTVLILGKGHEEYQIVGNQKIHFSDQETVRELLV